MELRWGAATHTGLVRTANEDAVFARDGLYAVADGMGGHAAGEVASSMAVEALRDSLSGPVADSERVTDAIRTANDAVHRHALQHPRLRGMGTTLTVVAVADNRPGQLRFVLANVGDSRAYLYAEGRLRQLTRDHSYVAELVAAGEISAAEALVHPHRHVVTRALGVEPLVAVDTWLVTPEPGDRYVLCSDGLVNEVDDDEIAALLAATKDSQDAAERLIDAANARGGRDNITVVVLDVDGEPPADSTPVDARVVEQELGGWLPLGAGDEFERATIEVPLTDAETFDAQPEAAPLASPVARRRRRVSTAGIVFGALVAAVFLAAFVIVAAYGRSGFYAGFADDGAVAIFQGRPGGVLWFQPTVEQRYELSRDDLQPEAIDRIESNPRYSSLGAVQRYVDRIVSNEANLVPVVSVPATTATTAATPRTSTAPTSTTRAPTVSSGAGP